MNRIVIFSIDDPIYYGKLYKRVINCFHNDIIGVIKIPYFREKGKGKLRNFIKDFKYRFRFYRLKGFLYISFRYIIFKIIKKGNFVLAAKKKGIDVFKVNNIMDTFEILKKLKPDVILCSVDEKIPRELLELAGLGWVNIHCGLLPKYAGIDAPFWAMLNREKEFGVTIHLMDEDFDSGSLLLQKVVKGEFNVYFKLVDLLFENAFLLLSEFLKNINEYVANAKPQDKSKIVYHKRPKIRDSKVFFENGKRFV